MLKPPAKPNEEKTDRKNSLAGLSSNPNKAIIINIAATVVLLIIFTFVIYSLIGSMMSKQFASFDRQGKESIEDIIDDDMAEERGVILDLGDFILNLTDTNPRRFLKVNVAIELSKTEAEIIIANTPVKKASGHGPAPADPMDTIIAEMDQYKPAIRDAIITVLTSKTSDELSTTTGKELSKEEIQDSVSSIFNGTREVLRVSFGQFVIQ